jgi:hypothetical protein
MHVLQHFQPYLEQQNVLLDKTENSMVERPIVHRWDYNGRGHLLKRRKTHKDTDNFLVTVCMNH